jgi:hypothetical protein
MKASYLIALIEDFCNVHRLDISKVYKKMADVYQNEYGVNIVMLMEADGYHGMPEYLESKNIVERYVHILNGLEKMIKNNWDLELDKL